MTKKQFEKKLIKKAQFATKILKNIPFVRMIAINGSLASGKTNKNSDIDFFLIVEKGHLWTARFLVIAILDIFRLRAKEKNQERRICINHILSNAKYILKLKNQYNYQQYSNLWVLYNQEKVYQKFISQNTWMKRFGKIKKYYISHKKSFWQKIFEFKTNLFGNHIERYLKNYQLKRIRKNPFYHQKDTVKCFSDGEFYYYTKVSQKWKTSSEKSRK
jgi:predicted nucleotidyltransferase